MPHHDPWQALKPEAATPKVDPTKTVEGETKVYTFGGAKAGVHFTLPKGLEAQAASQECKRRLLKVLTQARAEHATILSRWHLTSFTYLEPSQMGLDRIARCLRELEQTKLKSLMEELHIKPYIGG